jgi:tetratricopeptide (TPR) repeat protein
MREEHIQDQAQRAREVNEQGAHFYQQGNYQAAIGALTQAITLSPAPEWAFYFNRGRARDDLDDLPAAIAD